jgi:hypothetical protein
MITIEHEGATFELPVLQSEFSVRQASQFIAALHVFENASDEASRTIALIEAAKVFAGQVVYDLPIRKNAYSQILLELDQDVYVEDIISHMVGLINKEPDPISEPIQIGGNDFYLSGQVNNLLDAKAYTAGEVIELQMLQRDVSLLKKAQTMSAESIVAFTQIETALSASAMVMLLRKENEKLPYNVAEMTAFVNSRFEIMANAPYSICAAVGFFLRNILAASVLTKSIKQLLKGAPLQSGVLETQ